MTVNAILSAKGAEVVTIDPNATLEQVARCLADKRIGALVITGAEDRIVGIASERDIVRMLAAHGAAALSMPVSAAMTRRVVTCARADTVSVLMERMTENKFRHLPVVERDRLVGIVSIGDVVKLRVAEMESEQRALRDYIQTA